MSVLNTNGPIVAQQTILDTTAGKILTICVNLIILTELCIAMFLAAQEPEGLTEVFFKTFFSLLIPTLLASAVAKRCLIKRVQR